MQECVSYGLQMAKEKNCIFTWVTATNRGSSDVCEAALAELGISLDDLEHGYLCDPTSKSTLRILAIAGLVLRLTRNLDKQRGFVNRALAVVCESLSGNGVIIARLVGTGNGYSTTIRRAQGASLDLGCIYFDQHWHHAGRGYGYVAVSRFRTRAGCFLYGKLRRTDFLPVGEDKEDEVLERGFESETSDEEEKGMEHSFQGGGNDIFDVFQKFGDDEPERMNDDFPSSPLQADTSDTSALYDDFA